MSPGPLTGVRVVELAGIGPAPFAAMMLAELGADVVKIDRPGGSGFAVPWQYDLTNRGRPSVCVDLKYAAGVDVVRRLVATADVFIEGMRPGVTERLGLGPDELLALRPQLVYGRMTGWGQDGPKAQQAGHDIGYLAASGVLAAIGPKERPAIPAEPARRLRRRLAVPGHRRARRLARSPRHPARARWSTRRSSTASTHLSTALHGLVAAGLWSDRRADNLLDGGTPFYDVYETSDGEFMAVGPLEPKFYDEFVRLLDPDEPLPERTDVERWPAAAAADRRSVRPTQPGRMGRGVCRLRCLRRTRAPAERGSSASPSGRARDHAQPRRHRCSQRPRRGSPRTPTELWAMHRLARARTREKPYWLGESAMSTT